MVPFAVPQLPAEYKASFWVCFLLPQSPKRSHHGAYMAQVFLLIVFCVPACCLRCGIRGVRAACAHVVALLSRILICTCFEVLSMLFFSQGMSFRRRYCLPVSSHWFLQVPNANETRSTNPVTSYGGGRAMAKPTRRARARRGRGRACAFAELGCAMAAPPTRRRMGRRWRRERHRCGRHRRH